MAANDARLQSLSQVIRHLLKFGYIEGIEFIDAQPVDLEMCWFITAIVKVGNTCVTVVFQLTEVDVSQLKAMIAYQDILTL